MKNIFAVVCILLLNSAPSFSQSQVVDFPKDLTSFKKIQNLLEDYVTEYPDDDGIEIEKLRKSLDDIVYNLRSFARVVQKIKKYDQFFPKKTINQRYFFPHYVTLSNQEKFSSVIKKYNKILEIYPQTFKYYNLFGAYSPQEKTQARNFILSFARLTRGYRYFKNQYGNKDGADLLKSFLIEGFDYQSGKIKNQTNYVRGIEFINDVYDCDVELKIHLEDIDPTLYQEYLQKYRLKTYKNIFQKEQLFTKGSFDEQLKKYTAYQVVKRYLEKEIKKIEIKLDFNLLKKAHYNPEQIIYMAPPYDACIDDFKNMENLTLNYQQWIHLYQAIKATGTEVIINSKCTVDKIFFERWTRDLSPVVYNNKHPIILWSFAQYQKYDLGDGKLLSKYPTRKNTKKVFSRIFNDSALTQLEVLAGTLDGGDTLFYPAAEVLFIGVNPDLLTKNNAPKLYQEVLNEAGYSHIKIIPLHYSGQKKIRSYFYHVDTFMARAGKKIILYKDAITADSLQKIEEVVGKDNIFNLHFQTATYYPTNYVQVGNLLIIPQVPSNKQHGLYNFLNKNGYILYPINGIDSGRGGPHCNTFDVGTLPDARNFYFSEDERSELKDIEEQIKSLFKYQDIRTWFYAAKRYLSAAEERSIKNNQALWTQFEELQMKYYDYLIFN